MKETLGFRMSQGLDVLIPKSGNAYPIPCDDWEFLKAKLRQVSELPWGYQNVASVLAGVALTTLVTIILGLLPPLAKSNTVVIAWAVVAVTTICGLACLHFANEQRKMRSVHVSSVILQMEIIEHRYVPATNAAAGIDPVTPR
jgi:hypothetical protein